jgi:NAD(P)-dependent dehydrogenase (short-subunit alcohol dehydrogenase family)
VWYAQQLLETRWISSPATALRQGGTYIIVGGSGLVGRVLSEWLLTQYRAQVIWIGRRACDAQIAAEVDRLAALGPRVHYINADAGDAQALRAAREQTKEHPRRAMVSEATVLAADPAERERWVRDGEVELRGRGEPTVTWVRR